jgi:hypothetical protein
MTTTVGVTLVRERQRAFDVGAHLREIAQADHIVAAGHDEHHVVASVRRQLRRQGGKRRPVLGAVVDADPRPA